MSPISIGVLAITMSVDAFIASLGKGAASPRSSFGLALRTGVIFGVIEMITPLIGWAAGVVASGYVKTVDHWIAFALLSAVGLHMAFQAWTRQEEDGTPSTGGLRATILTAVGTSLDAMAVGVSLAFLQVNIFVIALCIGAATMVMSSTGILAGRFLGQRFGRAAETIGGFVLCGLGAYILFEHLTVA